MLAEAFREYARPKGQGRAYLENLAGFFLAVARDQGEEEQVRMVIGEDPVLGPYLDVDLREAPRTHAWLSAFREAAKEGAALALQENEDGTVDATVLPPRKAEA
ncbi:MULTISPECIES: hypothetical protein [Thermus]|uniref:Uncharacterized protein n=4 Tax=Thermus TaxID=270 RepID=A0A4Y9FB17_9DEIN|nr:MULTISPECIES: hypothetical protein [Thermus]TBH16579.1 hypothetical protein ETP66_10100 [Thermus thermamylovorans]TFU16020.1 hypothetical protein E0489_07685 [Thermus tengchongensis]TFU26296.1 hypothetical protein E0687_06790 [Thermus tengchongensis]SDE87441.1 hypothetical protein SAMN04488243_11420 [Thermus arciformis]VCU54547.1 hypothetical protein TTHNP3_00060 [Thermus thermophilus]